MLLESVALRSFSDRELLDDQGDLTRLKTRIIILGSWSNSVI